MRPSIAAFAVALSLGAPSAWGASARKTGELERRLTPAGAPSKGAAACHEDIERFCHGTRPGGGRLGACLKAHKSQLSSRCLRWARHGGKAHEDEAFDELDRDVNPAPARRRRSVKPASAPVPQ